MNNFNKIFILIICLKKVRIIIKKKINLKNQKYQIINIIIKYKMTVNKIFILIICLKKIIIINKINKK